MYYKLTKEGVERHPGFNLSPKTLFQDINVPPKEQRDGTYDKLLELCGHENIVLDFQLDEYYRVPYSELSRHGQALNMTLAFRFTQDLGKHEAFKLTFDPYMENDQVLWQISLWSKPTTNVFEMTHSINCALVEFLNNRGFSFDGIIQPIELTEQMYYERYIRAKAQAGY